MAPSLQHRRAPRPRWLRVSPLGSGSFGTVSLCLNPDDGLLFAVKSTPFSPNSPQVTSLQNELHILQTLESPRVVRCLGSDISLVDNTPCFNLFLEYMQQGSLADLMKKSGGKLDEARVAVCTRAILEGLCYLHKQGIVHSDIKAQNILLGSCGEIKIADFGAARRISSPEKSDSAIMRGTPLWMAPEVVQGVEQGTPSDIWSLGCTIVEMLQGRPPWGSIQGRTSATDVASLLFKIAYTSEDPPLLVDSSFTVEARDFLSKCLQRNPKERWTAEQLLQHPFVLVKEESVWSYGSQASPRSGLDFYVDSDWESESFFSHDTFMSPIYTAEPYDSGSKPKELVHSDVPVTKESWLTVRHAEDWLESRQKPFFGAKEELIVRKGTEVNFESVGFLAKRVKAVVR